MTDSRPHIMDSALETRLRIVRGNVAEAEAWLQQIPSNHPDHEEALEEFTCWQEQLAEIEERISARQQDVG